MAIAKVIDPQRQAISQNLRRFRKIRRMTQEEVAAKVGVSSNYIHRIERDGMMPGLVIGLRLAEIFGVYPEDLIRIPKGAPADAETLERIQPISSS